jgi:hypothetical protein
MRVQEKIKLKRRTDEPMKARKELRIINSVNQQNPKMNKVKCKEQSTLSSTWKKSYRNTGISKCLSVITLNVNRLNSPIKRQKARYNNLLSARNILHNQRHTQTK